MMLMRAFIGHVGEQADDAQTDDEADRGAAFLYRAAVKRWPSL